VSLNVRRTPYITYGTGRLAVGGSPVVDLRWLLFFLIFVGIYVWVRRYRDVADALMVSTAVAVLLLTALFMVPVPIFVV
jgi:hypothetical protein